MAVQRKKVFFVGMTKSSALAQDCRFNGLLGSGQKQLALPVKWNQYNRFLLDCHLNFLWKLRLNLSLIADWLWLSAIVSIPGLAVMANHHMLLCIVLAHRHQSLCHQKPCALYGFPDIAWGQYHLHCTDRALSSYFWNLMSITRWTRTNYLQFLPYTEIYRCHPLLYN